MTTTPEQFKKYSQVFSYFATVKPRFSDLPDTICRATFTIELPQAAPAPLNPSSVPNGLDGFLTSAMYSRMKNRFWLVKSISYTNTNDSVTVYIS